MKLNGRLFGHLRDTPEATEVIPALAVGSVFAPMYIGNRSRGCVSGVHWSYRVSLSSLSKASTV